MPKKSFGQLKARAEQPDYRHEEEVPLVSWTAESDRLEMWTLNVGALQTGQSSLESRLGKSFTSQEVSKGVAKLLEDLDSFLTEILREFSKAGPSASDDDASLGTSIEQTTELQQLHGLVVSVIDNLNELSTLIQERIRRILDCASKGSSVEDDEK
ncbi:MAG: hypothetical protein Q9161_005333 [Pseudevernia consocians]